MKFSHSRSDSGSVLVTTLIVTFVLGITLASFLTLTQHQTLSNSRSQSWNHTLAVTESGVEDALQMINRYADDSTRILNWASDIQAGGTGADQWTYLGNHIYTATRTIGDPVRAEYEIRVNNSRPNAPSIHAKGWLVYNFEYDHPAVATAGTAGSHFRTTKIKREVVVSTRRDGLFTTAMLADVSIDLNGNNIHTDSFNSADPTASYWGPGATHGVYDPTLASDKGDVACNSNLEDSLNTGNADIMGHVSTGPGGSVEIGSNGSVGSEDWVSSGNTGIQPGYSSDDMNVRLEDVELPHTTWTPLADLGEGGVEIGGVTYRHKIDLSGDYTVSTLQGSLYVASNVTARVWIKDNVNLGDGEQIQIDPNSGGLEVYMEGSRFQVGGSGVVNNTGDASKFLYFGLPSNTQVKFTGNASFVGAIYANHADFSMGGGGSDILDFIGSVVARTIKMNGHFNFHYDENLATLGPTRGFVPTTWKEL